MQTHELNCYATCPSRQDNHQFFHLTMLFLLVVRSMSYQRKHANIPKTSHTEKDNETVSSFNSFPHQLLANNTMLKQYFISNPKRALSQFNDFTRCETKTIQLQVIQILVSLISYFNRNLRVHIFSFILWNHRLWKKASVYSHSLSFDLW